ncbi:MAG: chaperone NapD [Methylobacteriaceae bacterium]|nr:chaperone NapD [Methylobacteriaceae bacterium]
MSGVHNVCGVVVHVAPGRLEAARAAIAALPGVELHAEADQGRLVATAVDTDSTMAIDQLAAINRIPGVVSTTLAYHAMDDEGDAAADSRTAPRAAASEQPRL